ncbi:MAG: DUF3025 domain-containing protein [Betaproteobacteria bacterium]|nr:MAG: DUF3025 domain-containing protein [Betaproteobacteria bacterium]
MRPALKRREWTKERITQSPMFAPFASIASRLPATVWPDVGALNALLDEFGNRVVNSNGKRIRFVPQTSKPVSFEQGFEPRAYLSGEVMVRPQSWHDLFNALVWMTFPKAKAVINARHFSLLQEQRNRHRSPAGDALTLFDEDGMVVLSSNAHLLELLRAFRWKELFWTHRHAVQAEMCFLLFGHAMYEKALDPFVGMTAKSILLLVPGATLTRRGAALTKAADTRVADYVCDVNHLAHGKAFSPLPVLGVPGWWPQNKEATFYDDVAYFRPGRVGGEPSESSSIS